MFVEEQKENKEEEKANKEEEKKEVKITHENVVKEYKKGSINTAWILEHYFPVTNKEIERLGKEREAINQEIEKRKAKMKEINIERTQMAKENIDKVNRELSTTIVCKDNAVQILPTEMSQ